MMRILAGSISIFMLLAAGVGCVNETVTDEDDDLYIDGKADSSVAARIMDFAMDGEVIIQSTWQVESEIESQLLYTVGQLNGDDSIGRLDRVELSNIETTELEEGGYLVTYHAVLPVAWNRRNEIPETYTFQLPRAVGYSALEEFTESYMHDCVDWGAHDVTSGVMWYYYRPERSGCQLDEADIVNIEATVSESALGTTGRYPEYHKVWEDEELRVVAIFGKVEEGATSNDGGITAYNNFVRAIRRQFADNDIIETPEDVPSSPGVEHPDVTIEATLDDGRRVHVVALMVDNVRSAGYEFDQRYEELSSSADLIIYNGHSGLGANIRALASKGSWVEGQYAIVYMNGCDTYAYVDSSLADAHAAVNPDDEIGTRYVDIIMNAMPAYFSSFDENSMTMIRGLLSYDEPRTYEHILEGISSSHVAIVAGEEDNVYHPGFDDDDDDPPPPPRGDWEGMDESGEVAAYEEVHFQTPELDAGRYVFEMTGTGDADLYVRLGDAPDAETYDCRPYRSDSNETCVADVPSPAVVHVMVRGYREASYHLTGRPE